MNNNLAIEIVSWVLILLGVFGAVLPLLPGLPVAWVGMLIYAIATHFETVTVWGLIVFGALIGLTIIVDVFAPAIAASGKKASKTGIVGAMVGGIVGTLTMGPIGILVGPFIGSFVGEMMHSGNSQRSLRVAWASMFGLVIGTGFKLVVGLSMIIYFAIKFF